jgi:hypothetical protein
VSALTAPRYRETYAVRFVDPTGQPLNDTVSVIVTELFTGLWIATSPVDARGFSQPLPLQTGVVYVLQTQSQSVPTATILAGRESIITVDAAAAAAASERFGQLTPYELIVPFQILAQFTILSSGAWIGTVTAGGMNGQWLNDNGASWLSEGLLAIPLDATKLQDAKYWHVDVAAVAAIELATATPTAMQIYSGQPVLSAGDLGGTTVASAATPLTVDARAALVVAASAPAVEIGFRFLAGSAPGLTCSAISGEARIKPYALQAGQSP